MRTKDEVSAGVVLGNQAALAAGVSEALGIKGGWAIECRDKHGNLKWTEDISNLVTNAGESYMLQAGLDAQTQITSWFIGLTDGTPTVAETDTMASHAGWVEVTAYSEAVRQAWTGGTESGQSIDNSAAPADFSINADSTTVGGAFLASSSTKGESASTLYAVGAFSGGDRAVDDGDTLSITATFTAGGT